MFVFFFQAEDGIRDLTVTGVQTCALPILGAINVPIYFNESPERMAYILNHSGTKVVITAGSEQARRLLACREPLGAGEQVIVARAPPRIAGGGLPSETPIAAAGGAEVGAHPPP